MWRCLSQVDNNQEQYYVLIPVVGDLTWSPFEAMGEMDMEEKKEMEQCSIAHLFVVSNIT